MWTALFKKNEEEGMFIAHVKVKLYLAIPSCSYWARVSGGQILSQNHTSRKPQCVPGRTLQSGSMKSLSAIYNLAQVVALSSETSRPQRTYHTETSDFHALSCCLVKYQGVGLSRNSLWWNKTARLFPHMRMKQDFGLYFCLWPQTAIGNVLYGHSTKDFTVYGFELL